MDDDYSQKAKAIKGKYTTMWEIHVESQKKMIDAFTDLIRGVVAGLVDIVKGAVVLVGNGPTLVSNGLILVISDIIPDDIEPAYLKDKSDNIKEDVADFKEVTKQIIEDPFMMVESIGQSISDTWEEEGVMYVSGYVAADVLVSLYGGKVLQTGKLSDVQRTRRTLDKVGDTTQALDKAGDVAKQVDRVEDVVKGVYQIEDAVRGASKAKGIGNAVLSSGKTKHVLNRHGFNNVKNQLGFELSKRSRNDVARDLAERSFFNKNWSNSKITEATQMAYNQVLQRGATHGRHTVTVFGEKITVQLNNGTFQTAWGQHKFKLSDFGF